MEYETETVLHNFACSAKEIMWVTNEIHDVLDELLEKNAKSTEKDVSENVCNAVRAIRNKLCSVNSINMEKLYGAPRNFLDFKGDVS